MKIKKSKRAAAEQAAETLVKKTKVGRTITNAKQESRSTSAGKAKTEAPEREKKSGVNIGLHSGLRVMAFQDETFKQNDKAQRVAPLSGPGRRTDEELAAEWRAEFPNSRAVQAGRITAEMVRSVRNLYNAGTGGHGTPGETHSSRPFIVQGKDRVVSEYVRTRKPAADETKTVPAQTRTVKGAHPKKVVIPGKKRAAAA